MKKLIVCGDSHMSPVKGKYAGTHFSEIVAEELGYEIIAYARGGMSNGGICIQIQTALTENPKPDLILVGSTYFTRMEWPINDIRLIEKFTIQHLLYEHHHNPSLSTTYDWLNQDPQLVSMNDYVNTGYDRYSNEREHAMTLYKKYLLHPDWKREIDIMCLYATYHQLHMSGIPYLICKEQSPLVVEKCKWLNYGKDNINYAVTSVERTLREYHIEGTPDYEQGYHTSIEMQRQVAKILLRDYLPEILK